MQLHQARKADISHKKKVRIGRGPGSGIGKTAGRGIKGATSRSGYAMKVTYEGGQMPLFRRLPKRGFRNGPFRVSYAVVNVGDLNTLPAGSNAGPEELRKAGILSASARSLLKVLGEGELTVALNVSADRFSKSAIAKIEKAGGKVAWIGGAPKKPAPDFKKIEAEKKKAAEKGKADAKAKGEGGDKAAKPAGEATAAKPAAPSAKPQEGK